MANETRSDTLKSRKPTHQYVDEKGRIVAEIRGSDFERERGWYAFDETTVPSTHLGRYVTLDDAKSAVIQGQKAKAKES